MHHITCTLKLALQCSQQRCGCKLKEKLPCVNACLEKNPLEVALLFVIVLSSRGSITFVCAAGYGVDSDFRYLVSSCPLFEDAVTRLARFVDLCPLSKQVGDSGRNFIPVNLKSLLFVSGLDLKTRLKAEEHGLLLIYNESVYDRSSSYRVFDKSLGPACAVCPLESVLALKRSVV